MKFPFQHTMVTLSVLGLFVSSPMQGQSTSESRNAAAGNVIAYCYQSETGYPQHFIFTVNEDGTGNAKLITASVGLNHMEYSPDGKRMALVGYMDRYFNTWSIHVYDFDDLGTGTLTRLTNTANVWDTEPSWSPDGSRIAFTRILPAQNQRNEVWIMNSDGSDLGYIGVQGFYPKWSPDGTKLVYASNVSGNWEIYTCRPDGTEPQKLTNTSWDETTPVWSSDGSKILFTFTGDGNSEIYEMNSDGSQPKRLTHNTSNEYTPKWSPDGSHIAFGSDSLGSNRYQIFVMDANGSDWRQVTNTSSPATAINPIWRPRSGSSIPGGQSSLPTRFALDQNYPNPFNPATTIPFEVRGRTAVRLEIFDPCGKMVKRLFDGEKSEGTHSLSWDGTDSFGQDVPSGLYLFRLASGRDVHTRKAVLCR